MVPEGRFQEIVGSTHGLTVKNDKQMFSRLTAPELLYEGLHRLGGGEKGGSESVPHPAAHYSNGVVIGPPGAVPCGVCSAKLANTNSLLEETRRKLQEQMHPPAT